MNLSILNVITSKNKQWIVNWESKLRMRLLQVGNKFTVFSCSYYYCSLYIVAVNMLNDDYEKYLLAGWRRCGNELYQQVGISNKCIQRTIVLDTNKFKSDRSQRRVISRFDRFLKGELKLSNGELVGTGAPAKQTSKKNKTVSGSKCISVVLDDVVTNIKEMMKDLIIQIYPDITEICTSASVKISQKVIDSYVYLVSPVLFSINSVKVDEKLLLSLIQSRIGSRFVSVSIQNHYINFNTGIRHDKEKKKAVKPPRIIYKSKTLRRELVPAHFDQEAYNLYRKFEMSEFGKTIQSFSEKSFTWFLGKGCLPLDDKKKEGTFWWKWYIDNELIAVSVLDLLPHLISSVYFFYDPVYKPLSIGIYGALAEIDLARSMVRPLYSLGLYIHECARMRYKAAFKPSRILCATTHCFYPMEVVGDLLDTRSICLERDESQRAQYVQQQAEKGIETLRKSRIFAGGRGLGFRSIELSFDILQAAKDDCWTFTKIYNTLMEYVQYLPTSDTSSFCIIVDGEDCPCNMDENENDDDEDNGDVEGNENDDCNGSDDNSDKRSDCLICDDDSDCISCNDHDNI